MLLREKINYHSFLCLVLVLEGSNLPSATVDMLSLLSVIANVPNILETITLIYPSIDKSKCKTHSRYKVIINRFQSRSNVMQMSLYK